ncbi:MAG: CCA tRNA nucleotidyltransferase [Dehalococcoidia bacterium]|nr:CCA tRNA nucleotidyltransferase [Dehalococcoidia bacterium]
MPATRDDFVQAFAASGHQLWLVGGALRDRLLGHGGHDDDFATDALPDTVEELAAALGLPVITVGKKFGTIGVHLDGQWSEVTTFRGDSYSGGTRWPDVTFGTSIEEDLARRDFTINALAENAVTGEVLDLFGGREDLAAGVIRAVGAPAQRFREDPLRILRGLRFASQLDFEIETETLAGMAATVELLATLSQERVTTELDRMLQGRKPGRGLEQVRAIGALPFTLPELAPMPGCEQNSFHRFDVWGHTVATVDAIDPGGPEDVRVRRWTALLHDVGKPAVRHVKPNGEWGFYRHETTGETLAHELLERLRMARKDSVLICLLIRRHMDRPDPADRRSVRRFIAKAKGNWEHLLALKRADNASHTYDDDAYHDALWAACAEVARDDAEALLAESPLSGDDLVAIFGRPPGPWIKLVKERLSAAVLEGELAPGDRGGAERIARTVVGRA